jgi:hypothetical protein
MAPRGNLRARCRSSSHAYGVYYRQQTMQYLKEVTMETLLLIVGVAAIALFLFRPAPQAQIIYVPVEVAAPQSGLGCLPMIVVSVLALLVLFALGGIQI